MIKTSSFGRSQQRQSRMSIKSLARSVFMATWRRSPWQPIDNESSRCWISRHCASTLCSCL